uniref:Uncharacterized protein n=1 Tax=Amphilophus citrinellus TaxID=61819 RepID=A0A3Q0T2Q4_AMPCI
MAALRAELRLRDGQRQTVSVQVETHLSSLIRGISELNVNVSELLSELVEQEKTREDKENDSEEDEDPEEEPNCEVQPPTKRSRT